VLGRMPVFVDSQCRSQRATVQVWVVRSTRERSSSSSRRLLRGPAVGKPPPTHPLPTTEHRGYGVVEIPAAMARSDSRGQLRPRRRRLPGCTLLRSGCAAHGRPGSTSSWCSVREYRPGQRTDAGPRWSGAGRRGSRCVAPTPFPAPHCEPGRAGRAVGCPGWTVGSEATGPNSCAGSRSTARWEMASPRRRASPPDPPRPGLFPYAAGAFVYPGLTKQSQEHNPVNV
jgi:hypothetical protein